MKLYSYFRSSATYRVRIALALKGLSFDLVSIHLAQGKQYGAEFSAVSPQNLVPVLEDEPAPVPVAGDPRVSRGDASASATAAARCVRTRRAFTRAAGRLQIHPLNNTRVLNYITGKIGATEAQKLEWYHHWVKTGFAALEHRLSNEPETGRFCHGEQPGFADCALVPQVANANRFEVDLSEFPTIRRINEACLQLEAFQRAAPANQPDAD